MGKATVHCKTTRWKWFVVIALFLLQEEEDETELKHPRKNTSIRWRITSKTRSVWGVLLRK